MSPKEECELLVENFLPFVEQSLQKKKGFLPVGAVLGTDKQIMSIAICDEKLDNSPTIEIVNLYVELYQGQAEKGEIVASFLAYDTVITHPQLGEIDAIAVNLDHVEDYSIIVFWPYRLKKKGVFKNSVVLLEPIANAGEYKIFKQI